MAGGMNLASKYASEVDEKFHKESQAVMALNNHYKFTGVQTVNVYSVPVVAMRDYTRSGTSRYGTPDDLTRSVQTLKVGRDRAFTFIIDQGDRTQSMMVMDAGRALSRQIREVWVPEYDTYVFRTLAARATARGNYSTTELTRDNAYEQFLHGMEVLGNKNVPDQGRVCFCSYRFANLLKQDSAFMRYGDRSQEMLRKGVIGEVDGCRIVKVPASRLPAGCAFLMTHPMAATGPKQLESFKIHDNPPGINGYLVEGRVIYDCFVLNEKADAVYYHGSQAVLKPLNVTASVNGSGTAALVVEPGAPESGNSWKYQVKSSADALDTVTYGTAITASAWTALIGSGVTITADAGGVVAVVEVDSAGKPLGYGTAEVR